MLPPLALVMVAVLATDVVFAVDSAPAVYGITEDPFLVTVTSLRAAGGEPVPEDPGTRVGATSAGEPGR